MPPSTITRPQRAELRERVGDVGGRVDRQAGIIYGVRVIGTKSRNGRTYSESALRGAVSKYESCAVNFDHTNGERSSKDLFGELRNVRMDGDGIRADLHFLKSHPMAESVCEAAERMPNRFGLSHHADGRTVRQGGQVIVESIEVVHSVDIVSKPATNRGLFESHNSKGKIMQQSAINAAVRKVLMELDVGTEDDTSDGEAQTLDDLSTDEKRLILVLRSDATPEEKRRAVDRLIGGTSDTDPAVTESLRRQKPSIKPASLRESHGGWPPNGEKLDFRSGLLR